MKQPTGLFRVSLDGIDLPASSIVVPQNTYKILVNTIGQTEEINVECSPSEATTACEMARRAQIMGTIQAIRRRGLEAELNALSAPDELSPDERRFVYSTEPKLGTILGVGITGKYGQPLADAAGSLNSFMG